MAASGSASSAGPVQEFLVGLLTGPAASGVSVARCITHLTLPTDVSSATLNLPGSV